MNKKTNKFAMRIASFALIMLIIGGIAYAEHRMEEKKITNGTSLKAYITSVKRALEKDTEELPILIKKAENILPKVEDIPTKSILSSMIAEMYKQYCEQNAFAINDRSDLKASTPDQIQEWNKEQFDSRIDSLLTASLENKNVLCKTSLQGFKDILTKETQQNTASSLYEFLSLRAITIAPNNERYEALLAYQQTLESKEAAIQTN